jgi:DNA-binding transcriptional LysR family regulator
VPKGRPKISVPTVLGWRVIVPALPCFVGAHREVELDLWLDDRKVDIVDEDSDAVLRLGELTDSGLIAQKVAPHHFTTSAAQSYLAAHGTPKVRLNSSPIAAYVATAIAGASSVTLYGARA